MCVSALHAVLALVLIPLAVLSQVPDLKADHHTTWSEWAHALMNHLMQTKPTALHKFIAWMAATYYTFDFCTIVSPQATGA